MWDSRGGVYCFGCARRTRNLYNVAIEVGGMIIPRRWYAYPKQEQEQEQELGRRGSMYHLR